MAPVDTSISQPTKPNTFNTAIVSNCLPTTTVASGRPGYWPTIVIGSPFFIVIVVGVLPASEPLTKTRAPDGSELTCRLCDVPLNNVAHPDALVATMAPATASRIR